MEKPYIAFLPRNRTKIKKKRSRKKGRRGNIKLILSILPTTLISESPGEGKGSLFHHFSRDGGKEGGACCALHLCVREKSH